MKHKSIFAGALFLLASLTAVSCEESKKVESKENYEIGLTGLGSYIQLTTIDSCEYLISDVYGGYSVTHHENCRFCRERKKM